MYTISDHFLFAPGHRVKLQIIGKSTHIITLSQHCLFLNKFTSNIQISYEYNHNKQQRKPVQGKERIDRIYTCMSSAVIRYALFSQPLEIFGTGSVQRKMKDVNKKFPVL